LAASLFYAMIAFGISGIGWNAIFLTMIAESRGPESAGLATGVGYFFGFMGSLFCPPLFGFLVDRTGNYGSAWLFLAFCAGATILLLGRFREDSGKDWREGQAVLNAKP
jgi:cyanate permease